MTNPKDPQADIREAILTIVYAHVDLPSSEHETEANIAISELVELFQAHQQELLTELLSHKCTAGVINPETGLRLDVDWLPVSVIERYREGL